MKLCRTCRYGSEYELDKPCVVYRADCPLYQKEGDGMTREEAIEVIKQDIPCEYDTDLIEALDMAIKALEQEPTTKNDLGVDAVSRQQAIERLKLNFPISDGADNSRDRHRYMQVLADIQAIRELPSVTPQEPKTGHWIRISPAEIYECSECGQNVMTSDICVYKFCHGCGAKMVEPQESEDKG